MRGLDLNTKRLFFFGEFGIFDLKGEGGIVKFRKNDSFKYNSAQNYFGVTKFHMKRLYFNTQKQFSSTLEFSILRWVKGRKKLFLFQKFQIFEHNSATNNCRVRKFLMWNLDLNIKKPFSVILEFLILRGGQGKNIEF